MMHGILIISIKVMTRRRKYPKSYKTPKASSSADCCYDDCPQCGRDGCLRRSKSIESDDICWICINTFQVKRNIQSSIMKSE